MQHQTVSLHWSGSIAPSRRSCAPHAHQRVVQFLVAALLATPWLAAQAEKNYDLTTAGDSISISVNENQGLALVDFIKIAQKITDKTMIYAKDEIDQAPRIHFIGTFTQKKEEFFGFFQTLLYIKNFACVLRADDKLVNIVSMRGAQRPEISAGAQLVPAESLEQYKNQTGVTVLTSIPLEHVNANQASTNLRPFFAPSGGSGPPLNFVAISQKSLLMQGFAPQVYQAYRLLRLVDQPEEEIDLVTQAVRLEHAAAEELEPLLNDLMTNRARQRPAVAGNQPQTPEAEMKILAHTSADMLILMGTRAQVNEAHELIAQLDQKLEESQGDSHVIQLRNVLARDLQQTIKQFLDQERAAEQQAQAGQAATQARRPRNPVVVAHEESNKLIVSAPATKFAQLEKMIQELDERQRQVLVECAVVELSTSDLYRFGVELGLLDIKDNGDFTRPFGFTHFNQSVFNDTDDDGLPDTRLPDFDNPLQGITGGIISGGDFAIPVLINALGEDSQANVLSLPSVIVNNNENAVVESKEERPTQNVSQGNATTQSGFGGFQDAGITLTISPSISSNNYLRLNVDLTVSRFITAFDPNSTTPGVKTTRQIKTQVTLPSGHTMVIGGVIEDSESTTDSGVPILMDIPLLGWLFKTHANDKRKTNLYFFITPHILDERDFADLDALSTRKKLEAQHYIGPRRLEIIDPKWDPKRNNAVRLEDPGSTLDQLEEGLGTEFSAFPLPEEKKDAESKDNKPPLPGTKPQSGRNTSGQSNTEKR